MRAVFLRLLGSAAAATVGAKGPREELDILHRSSSEIDGELQRLCYPQDLRRPPHHQQRGM